MYRQHVCYSAVKYTRESLIRHLWTTYVGTVRNTRSGTHATGSLMSYFLYVHRKALPVSSCWMTSRSGYGKVLIGSNKVVYQGMQVAKQCHRLTPGQIVQQFRFFLSTMGTQNSIKWNPWAHNNRSLKTPIMWNKGNEKEVPKLVYVLFWYKHVQWKHSQYCNRDK